MRELERLRVPSRALSITAWSEQPAGSVLLSNARNSWSGESCCRLQCAVGPPTCSDACSPTPSAHPSRNTLVRSIFFTSSIAFSVYPAGNSSERISSAMPAGSESLELAMTGRGPVISSASGSVSGSLRSCKYALTGTRYRARRGLQLRRQAPFGLIRSRRTQVEKRRPRLPAL